MIPNNLNLAQDKKHAWQIIVSWAGPILYSRLLKEKIKLNIAKTELFTWVEKKNFACKQPII